VRHLCIMHASHEKNDALLWYLCQLTWDAPMARSSRHHHLRRAPISRCTRYFPAVTALPTTACSIESRVHLAYSMVAGMPRPSVCPMPPLTFLHSRMSLPSSARLSQRQHAQTRRRSRGPRRAHSPAARTCTSSPCVTRVRPRCGRRRLPHHIYDYGPEILGRVKAPQSS
jgi:hypothetical protein